MQCTVSWLSAFGSGPGYQLVRGVAHQEHHDHHDHIVNFHIRCHVSKQVEHDLVHPFWSLEGWSPEGSSSARELELACLASTSFMS